MSQNLQDRTIGMADPGRSNANLVYILYLLALVVGITAIIGVVMAYINRNAAPDWLKTHYTFQIRTFWISLLYTVIGVVLDLRGDRLRDPRPRAHLVYRALRERHAAFGRNQPIADPESWMLG